MQYITLILIGSHSNLRHQNKPFTLQNVLCYHIKIILSLLILF